jgi:hypothetical protein
MDGSEFARHACRTARSRPSAHLALCDSVGRLASLAPSLHFCVCVCVCVASRRAARLPLPLPLPLLLLLLLHCAATLGDGGVASNSLPPSLSRRHFRAFTVLLRIPDSLQPTRVADGLPRMVQVGGCRAVPHASKQVAQASKSRAKKARCVRVGVWVGVCVCVCVSVCRVQQRHCTRAHAHAHAHANTPTRTLTRARPPARPPARSSWSRCGSTVTRRTLRSSGWCGARASRWYYSLLTQCGGACL